MTEPGDVRQMFARRSVWHIVEGGPMVGNAVAEFYLFRCFRWARAKQVREVLHQERLRPDQDPCVACHSQVATEVHAAPAGPVNS